MAKPLIEYIGVNKTKIRNAMKRYGISRAQLEKECLADGFTFDDKALKPLPRWFEEWGI